MLSSSLFGHLEEAMVDTLVGRTLALFERLDLTPDAQADMQRVMALHGLPTRAGPVRIPLEAVRKQCRRRLREFPIAALLSTSAPFPPDMRSDYDALLGWTVLASLSVLARDPYHASKVGSACAAVRLIADGNEVGAIAEFVGGIQSADHIFEAALAAEYKGTRHPHAIRFAPIRVLLEAYREGKSAITRDNAGGEGEEDDLYHLTYSANIAPMDLPEEIDGPVAQHITVAYLRSVGDEHGCEQDFHRLEADVPSVGSPSEQRSRLLQTARREVLLHDSLKRRMALPAHYGGFTDHEIACVMQASSSLDESGGRTHWREHVLLVTSLLTGIHPAEVARLPRSMKTPLKSATWFDTSSEDVRLRREMAIARPAFPDHARLLLNDTPTALSIALPRELSRGLRRLWSDRLSSSPSSRDIENAFRDLTKGLGRRQTIRRMISVLRDRLVADGMDCAMAAWICGNSPQAVPALHYATWQNQAIETAYRRVVDAFPGARFHWPVAEHHMVGSSLNVREEMIARFYNAAHAELISLARNSRRDLISFHNRFVSLVIVSMSLLTGHRPVRQPFESLSDYDRRRRWLFISDKELRTVSAGRFIPVPDLFEHQLGKWLSHLRSLALRLDPRDAEAREACRGALAGHHMLFFYLSLDEQSSQIRALPVVPKSLKAQIGQNIWPLPLNWGRHVLRRLLAGLPSDCIDALMGHADPGAEAFAAHSGLGAHDLEDIRDALNQLVTIVGARVFTGLE
jgi:hypothetical protein